jgi:hypothetical protein
MSIFCCCREQLKKEGRCSANFAANFAANFIANFADKFAAKGVSRGGQGDTSAADTRTRRQYCALVHAAARHIYEGIRRMATAYTTVPVYNSSHDETAGFL